MDKGIRGIGRGCTNEIKEKARKYTVRESEALSETNNALLKVAVKAHLWKQLEEGKHAIVTDLSKRINISMRYVQPIIRLYDLAPEVKDDKFDRRQPSSLRWAVFEGNINVMGWEIGKVLGVSILNYAHLWKQILTERKTSWKHQKR